MNTLATNGAQVLEFLAIPEFSSVGRHWRADLLSGVPAFRYSYVQLPS